MRFLTLASIAIASTIAVAAPASAVVTVFANFTAVGNTPNMRWVVSTANLAGNFSRNAVFYTTATGTSTAPAARAVNFTFQQPSLSGVGTLAAKLTLNGTVTNTIATVSGSPAQIMQTHVNGSFSFVQTAPTWSIGMSSFGPGTILLSGTFTNSTINGNRNGSSAGWAASTPASSIMLTSDVLDFVGGSNFDLAWSLASITPLLNATGAGNSIALTPNKALRSFRAVLGGQFSSDPAPLVPTIPEPAVWAQLILGFGMVGFAARRRKITIAA